MAKMVPKTVKRAGTLNRHLRVNKFEVFDFTRMHLETSLQAT